MKDFLLIANQNAITYKEFFPFLKKGQVSVGYTKPTEYLLPNGDIQKSGDNIWFSTLPTPGKKTLTLTKTYNKQDYPHYDNYDAIEVGKVANIPDDYYGVMGVPITFLDKYNPEQFEIVGMSSSAGYTKEIVGLPLLKDGDARPLIDGKNTYARIFIRRKTN